MEKDAFYEQLKTVKGKLLKSDEVIEMGDLQAKVGSGITLLEHVMGKHDLGDRNGKGGRFAIF